MARLKDQAIGQKLVAAGVLDAAQLERAMETARREGVGLQQVVVDRLRLATLDTWLKSIADAYGISYVTLSSYVVDDEALALVPREAAERHCILPLYCILDTLTIAIADPLDLIRLDELAVALKRPLKAVLAAKEEIVEGIRRHYGKAEHAMDEAVRELKAESPPDVDHVDVAAVADEQPSADLDGADAAAESAPIVRLINGILLDAVRRRATDVHIEPQEQDVRVRFRVDGVLAEGVKAPRNCHAHCVSRVKIMAGLDISERRLPQDGRFRAIIRGRPIDFRVSIVPTVQGEKVVLRLLDQQQVPLDLSVLGLDADLLARFRTALRAPYGMILATGPTASGKTTTLYAALSELNEPGVNIMTLEDPVEYRLAGVNQVQIRPKQGLTFEAGLEAFLRQDPDIILVGEIRSLETVHIAIRAALTGHLIFSTLHTNSAPEALARLIDMGTDIHLLGSALSAVLAQRLLRRICADCAEPDPIAASRLAALGAAIPPSPVRVRRGRGCDRCGGTGYFGRVGACELMRMTPTLREAIHRHASMAELERIAIADGMRTLRDAALRLAQEGVTTLEEATSVFLAE